jgi:hypothetical protein
MKNVLPAVFLALSLTVSAYGDDETLTADSTLDQVTFALKHEVDKIAGKYATTMANVFPEDLFFRSKQDVDSAASKFDQVNPKTLLDALNQTRRYEDTSQYDPNIFLSRQILFKAIDSTATQANLPDLLASQAPEALWVITNHTSWIRDPAVATFLGTQLGDMATQTSDDRMPDWIASMSFPFFFSKKHQDWGPSETWGWTVLNLARIDDDPAVQKELVDALQHAIDSSDSRPNFVTNAFEVVSRSNNPQVYTLSSGLMASLVKMVTFPVNRTFGVPRYLIDTHPALLKDATFDKNAIAFFKATLSVIGPDDAELLARLGDSDSFAATVAMYFGKDPLPFFGLVGTDQQSMRQQFNNTVEQKLFAAVDYRGQGDKMQGIKEHYHSAVYQDGHWVVTDPDDPAANQPIPPPAAPTAHTAVTPTPPPPAAPPVTPLAPATNSVAPVTATPPPAPAPVAAVPALPSSVSVIKAAPIEKLDASGQVTGVVSAVVGTSYTLVRVDGDQLVLKDDAGNQYKLDASATNFSSAAK